VKNEKPPNCIKQKRDMVKFVRVVTLATVWKVNQKVKGPLANHSNYTSKNIGSQNTG
jgi:hypothetical protein